MSSKKKMEKNEISHILEDSKIAAYSLAKPKEEGLQ